MVVGLCSLAVLGFSALYSGRIYPGVKVAGRNYGGLDYLAAQARLSEQLATARVDLTVGEHHYALTPGQSGLTLDGDGTIKTAMQVGRGQWGLLELFRRPRSLGLSYIGSTVASPQVAAIIATESKAPINATVSINGTQAAVVPGQAGSVIDAEQLEQSVVAAFTEAQRQVSLQPVPTLPAVQPTDAEAAVTTAQAIIASHLSLTYNGQTFSPSAATIGKWLSFAPDEANHKLVTQIDSAQVKNYLATVAHVIDVAPVKRKLTIINNETKSDEPGVNGLAVDQATLASQIVAQLPANPALTLVIPTVPVPFATVTNRTISLDFGRYIEVNLSTQHLWVYQDKQIVFDSPLTSGATGAGYPTVQGLFSIYSKERNRYLDGRPLGYNYNVYVQYWMPFFADYGLHDASWRSSFGGPDYYYNGSHGCVNLPTETAAWLFNWADIGTPVWVHG